MRKLIAAITVTVGAALVAAPAASAQGEPAPGCDEYGESIAAAGSTFGTDFGGSIALGAQDEFPVTGNPLIGQRAIVCGIAPPPP